MQYIRAPESNDKTLSVYFRRFSRAYTHSRRRYGPVLVSVQGEVLRQPSCRQLTQPAKGRRPVVRSGRGRSLGGRRRAGPGSDCEACPRRWTWRRRRRPQSGISPHSRRWWRPLVTTGRHRAPRRHLPASDQTASTARTRLHVSSCCCGNTSLRHTSQSRNPLLSAHRVVKPWNYLPAHVVDFTTLNFFKRLLHKADFSSFITIRYVFSL